MIYQCYFEASQRTSLFDSPLYRGLGLSRVVNPDITRNCPELEDPASQTLLSEYAAMLHLWRNPAPDGDPWVGFTSYAQLKKSPVILTDRAALEADLAQYDVVGWGFCDCVDTLSGRPVSVAAQAEACHPGITAALCRLLGEAGEAVPLAYLAGTSGLYCNYWAMPWANFEEFMAWSWPLVRRCLERRDAYTRSHARSLGFLIERLFICWYGLRDKRLLNLGPVNHAICKLPPCPRDGPSGSPAPSNGAAERTGRPADGPAAPEGPAADPAVRELFARAQAEHRAGRRAEAEGLLRRVLAEAPGHASALHDMGALRHEAGRCAEAELYFRRAVAADPGRAGYRNSLGAALLARGRLEEAEASCREALRLAPADPYALNNLGIALARQGRREEAEAVLRLGLEREPGDAKVLSNLAAVLRGLGRLDEAAAACRQALDGSPDFPQAHLNLGNALLTQGQEDRALAHFEEAIRCWPADDPEAAAAHLSRSEVWLRRGDLERGWREYEWRLRHPETPPRNFRRPAWDGSDPAGRTILLHTEQGLGDSIQFVRYAALVRRRGAAVLLDCPGHLMPLFATCPGVDRLVEEGGPEPEYDCHASLMSLPALLGTTLATIPAEVPYLAADAARAAEFAKRLAGVEGFRVGVNWRGNPRQGNDRYRSVALAQFAPLAQVPGVRLYSLQKGPGLEDLEALARRLGVTELVAPDLRVPGGTFTDTAAAMANLDLVVTVDSGPAHLAGALGVPAWVALSANADWRWLAGREDSPWYPTMRLFRQAKLGEWEPVFERMAAELDRLVRAKAPDAAAGNGCLVDAGAPAQVAGRPRGGLAGRGGRGGRGKRKNRISS
jgi:tetratricopeptide (TPR) repeat protein